MVYQNISKIPYLYGEHNYTWTNINAQSDRGTENLRSLES